MNALNECTALCKFALIGCPRRKCSFAHHASELRPRMCPHKERCRFDRRKRTGERACGMFHPDEPTPVEAVYERALEFAKPLSKSDLFHRTKLCKYYLTKCPFPNCAFAHSEDEVRALACPYGSMCPGDSCTFPLHGEYTRAQVLAYARLGVDFEYLPEKPVIVNLMDSSSESEEEPQFDQPADYAKAAERAAARVARREQRRLAKEQNEAMCAAYAAERAKEKVQRLEIEAERARRAEMEAEREKEREERDAKRPKLINVAEVERVYFSDRVSPVRDILAARSATPIPNDEERAVLTRVLVEHHELFSRHKAWVLASLFFT